MKKYWLLVCCAAGICLGIFGGAAGAQSQGSGASVARLAADSDRSIAYKTRVVQELQKRKFYPPKAKAADIEGSADFSFTIGATGRVVEHAITRSSGHPILDKAVGTILARIRPGPPPHRRWRAKTSMNFILEHPPAAPAGRPD